MIQIFRVFVVGTKYDLFRKCPNKFKYDITNKARSYAVRLHAPLIYCSSVEEVNIKQMFKLVVAKLFDLKPKLKNHHNEMKNALFEWKDQFYYKPSKKRTDTVFGYIRSLDMKYYMDDITYIILVYYGNAEKFTEEEH